MHASVICILLCRIQRSRCAFRCRIVRSSLYKLWNIVYN